jgi:NAD(P)-dependent dehydrogenase (short-subunit alcohol dehydrogenase family)
LFIDFLINIIIIKKMDKIALVTGTNRGIGLEISKQLAAKGITVIMTARNMQVGRPLVNELRRQWKHVWYHQLNITDEKSILDVFEYLNNRWEKLDILINNAGIFLDYGKSVLDLDLDIMRSTMETNLYGPLKLIQVMLPLLKKSEGARIINISSTMGQFSTLGGQGGAYRISKTALNALTVILSDELSSYGIIVNSVHPGWVRTDLGGPNAIKSIEEGADTAVWIATADKIPNGKFITDRKIIDW